MTFGSSVALLKYTKEVTLNKVDLNTKAVTIEMSNDIVTFKWSNG